MKNKTFNTKQIEAINSPLDKDVLVSASAGSGKTEILSYKVINAIENGISAEEILVLTFTNKAAYEMKQRIIKTAKKTSSDKSLPSKLLSAHIQTYDSYLLYLVKKYASYLNITSDIQIIDSGDQISLLKNQILDEYITSNILNKNPKMESLITKEDSYSFSNTKKLISEIYDKFHSFSKKEQELIINGIINNDETFYHEKYHEYLLDIMRRDYLYPLSLFIYVNTNTNIENSYEDIVSNFTNCFKLYSDEDLIKYCKDTNINNSWGDKLKESYLLIIDSLINEKFDELSENLIRNLSSSRGKDKNELVIKQALGENYPNQYDYLYELVQSGLNSQLHSIKLVSDDIKYIFEICKYLDEKINEYKTFSNMYEYKDLLPLVTEKLFNIKNVKEEIENQFKFIVVDEYQDTNDGQDYLLSLLSKKAKLFFVGDAKQSIYRFRGSNVELFINTREKLEKEGGYVIDMNYNYRSIEKVISDINQIFNNYMTSLKGGVNYDLEENRLSYDYKSDLYNKEKISSNTSNHGINIISYIDDDNNYGENIQEARIIASDIKEKIKNKYEIYDNHLESTRPCKYSDFAILVRRKRSFNDYLSIFERNQIPLENQIEVDLKDVDVFLLIRSLLSLLAIRLHLLSGNELHYFVSIARSYIYGNNSYYTDSMIHQIIVDKKNNPSSKLYEESEIIKKIDKIAKLYLEFPFSYVFNELIEEFGVLSKLNYIGSIVDNVEKIYSLYNNYCNEINSGGSLVKFLTKLDEYNKYDLKIKYSSDLSNFEAVKLMSLHGSKGLEFPIIYLPVSDNKVDVKPDKSMSLVSTKYGVLIPNYYPYLDGTITKPFLFDLNKKELGYEKDESENARLYYVLFTRAKESIFIVGNRPKNKKGVESLYSLLDYSNHNYVFEIDKIKDLGNEAEFEKLKKEYDLVTSTLSKLETKRQKFLAMEENNPLSKSFYELKINDYIDRKDKVEIEIYKNLFDILKEKLNISTLNKEEKIYLSTLINISNIKDAKIEDKKVKKICLFLLAKICNIKYIFSVKYQFNQKEVDLNNLIEDNAKKNNLIDLQVSNIGIKIKSENNEPNDIIFTKNEKIRASKQLVQSSEIDTELLSFGSDVHKILELIDIKKKDLSIFNNLDNNLKRLKPKIEKFLSLDILKDISDAKIYKEYEFYSRKNNSKGSIDLLIIKNNQVIIIDYKLKKIDDKEYVNQLNYYKEVVTDLFKIKDIKCYLYSILDETLLEI